MTTTTALFVAAWNADLRCSQTADGLYELHSRTDGSKQFGPADEAECRNYLQALILRKAGYLRRQEQMTG